jgi:hypothetical protein
MFEVGCQDSVEPTGLSKPEFEVRNGEWNKSEPEQSASE